MSTVSCPCLLEGSYLQVRSNIGLEKSGNSRERFIYIDDELNTWPLE